MACFSAVRENLNSGRDVLFSGTPCQIEGLTKYLGKRYDYLLAISVACHGVPSPRLWSAYIEWLRIKGKSPVKDFKFRVKVTGWRNYSVCGFYESGEIYSDIFMNDPYMKLFVNNISLRKSCFDCRFRGENSRSDIVLGDFWKIKEFAPEMDDNNGTSLVLLRTETALVYWNRVKSAIDFKNVDYVKALNSNRALYRNPILLRNRKKFFESYHTNQLDKVADRFTKQPLWKHCALILREKIIK